MKRTSNIAIMTVYGLEAIAGKEARVLVLGSFPGAESLAKRKYYASPRNRFWPLMDKLLGVEQALGYEMRVALLVQKAVALWDVLNTCDRTGSLDSRIRPGSENPNKFLEFLMVHPEIEAICFNGRKAAQLYSRLVMPSLPNDLRSMELFALPSTSPANAGFPLERLATEWRVVRDRAADA